MCIRDRIIALHTENGSLPSVAQVARVLGCDRKWAGALIRRVGIETERATRTRMARQIADRDGVSPDAIRMRINRYGEVEAFSDTWRKSG